MPQRTNDLGQPIGEPVPNWVSRPVPARTALQGRTCRLEPLRDEAHAARLHEQYRADREGALWTYLPYGPFEAASHYARWVQWAQSQTDPIFYAIVDLASGEPVGVASYLRIDPAMGAIEVGHLCFAPALQRTAASSEAMYLMMRHAFDDLGYRRYEWKCDSLNAPSLAAARRLGFRFEGTFRQAVVTKGRNRDTSWLSIVDGEWPPIRTALEAWLAPSNFDTTGRQRRAIGDLMPPAPA